MNPRNPLDITRSNELTEKGTLSKLRLDDVEQMREVEREAFADNPTLMDASVGAEQRLIEAEEQTAKGKPVLSMKFEKNGKTEGYFIAYETTYYGKAEVLPKGSPYIFLASMAVRNMKSVSGSRAAVALVRGMLETYKAEYLDKGNALPIIMATREQTSRKLLHHILTELQPSIGIQFQLSEGVQFESGGDQMYRTLLTFSAPEERTE